MNKPMYLERLQYIKDSLVDDNSIHWHLNPPDGYTSTCRVNSKKKSNGCCEIHNSMLDKINKWFTSFPNCCPVHIEMAKKSGFSKDRYSNVTRRVLGNIKFTEHIIIQNICTTDGRDNKYAVNNIIEYIDKTVNTLGILSIGAEPYLDILQNRLNEFDLSTQPQTKERLVKHIENLRNEVTKVSYVTPPRNSMLFLLEHWQHFFPFSLSFLKHLKNDFDLIIKEHPKTDESILSNRFVAQSASTSLKKDNPVVFAISRFKDELEFITKVILMENNTLSLYETATLNDPQEVKRELLLEERKLNLSFASEEFALFQPPNYIQTIQKWLIKEKKFLDELETSVDQKNLQNRPKVDSTSIDHSSNNENQNLETKRIIQDHISTLPDGWKSAFRSEDDYKVILNLLVSYFEGDNYELPKKTMILKPNCKTEFARVLNIIFTDLKFKLQKNGRRASLKGAKQFFEIIKIMNEFTHDRNVYKTINRNK